MNADGIFCATNKLAWRTAMSAEILQQSLNDACRSTNQYPVTLIHVTAFFISLESPITFKLVHVWVCVNVYRVACV